MIDEDQRHDDGDGRQDALEQHPEEQSPPLAELEERQGEGRGQRPPAATSSVEPSATMTESMIACFEAKKAGPSPSSVTR